MTILNSVAAYLSATLHADRREDRGASMVEYAVLVAAIAVMVGVVAALFSTKIQDFVSGINL